MANLFDSVPVRRPKKTSFNLSYSNKLSLDFGRLTPMMLEKVVPSDKFYLSDEFMCRFAPFFGQVFQAFKLRTEYFFCPSRLLWKNFDLFIASTDGKSMLGDTLVHPYVDMKKIWEMFNQVSSNLSNTIFDYFNLPSQCPKPSPDFKIDALPFYAYIKTFLDYYADENLDYFEIVANFEAGRLDWAIDGDNTARIVNLMAYLHSPSMFVDFDTFLYEYENNSISAGLQALIVSVMQPLRRSYPKDYFTSALPFAQRGPIIQIPLNGSGDVIAKGYSSQHVKSYSGIFAELAGGTPSGSEVDVTLFSTGDMAIGSSNNTTALNVTTNTQGAGHIIGSYGNEAMQADDRAQILNDAEQNAITFKAVNVNGTATITDLRTAITVQEWLEKKARSGVRLKENILSSFGVKVKDYRLDRSEFVQGFSSTVKIGEVFTTAANDDGTFVPGLGVSVGQLADSSKRLKHFFPEHGYFFGNVSIYPVASYSQGVPRQFLELDNLDYYWPEFQHLGEQQIYKCELNVGVANNMATFGYTPRYAHYKTRTDQIHGDFRESIKYMTSSRLFASQPSLNNDFIQIIPDKNALYRVFNATGEWEEAKPCYIDIFHNFKAVRPMSYYGNPRLV